MNKLKPLPILGAFLLLATVGTLAWFFSPQASADDVTKLALQPADLPTADWLEMQETNLADPSQPLSKENITYLAPDHAPLLTSYTTAYKASGLMRDESFAAYLGNYLYTFPSAKEAQAVVEVLSHSLLAVHDGTELENGNLQAQGNSAVLALSGQEGVIYFFVGSRENNVILLVADTMQPATVALETHFLDLVQLLQEK